MNEEWYWYGNKGSYSLLKDSVTSGSLNAGRVYKSSQTMGNGLVKRGWTVSRNKDPKVNAWWDADTHEKLVFLEHMPSKEAKEIAKTLLLARLT